MLRTRILAAATAAVLMLGMSVGGTAAAFAVVAPPSDIGGGSGGGSTPSQQCVPRGAVAETLEKSHDEYQRYSWKGGPISSAPTEVPPGRNWQANTTNYEGAGHGTDPIGVPFQRDNPGQGKADWFFWTKTKVIDQKYVPAVPAVICEVGLYLYKKTNPAAPASWPNSGPQTLIASQPGSTWFSTFPTVLPENVCGEGWAVQQDKVSHSGGFTWPTSITYPHDNIGWPPIYAAKHDNLEVYLDVPACESEPQFTDAAVAVTDPTCAFGQSLDIAGFVYDSALVTLQQPIVGNDPGTLTVVFTINEDVTGTTFDPSSSAENRQVSPDGKTLTITVTLAPALDDDECMPTLPVTNASIAFTAPTCDLGEGLNRSAFDFDAELAKLDSVTVDEDGDYVVVFTAIGSKTTFDQSPDVAEPGRTVSNGGKTLTFTGTLAGADTEKCSKLEIVDPFSYTDSCMLGQSYTLEFVDGLSYLVSINGGTAEQVMSEGQSSRTFTVQPGDSVEAIPVAASGYVLAAEQPTPLSRTFAEYGEGECDFPTLANWPANVTATNEVCTARGMTSGSLTVQLSTGPSDNPTPVRYFINYGEAGQRELVTATTALPAGTYVVTAVVAKQGDSVNDSGPQATFTRTVGAVDTSTCDLTTLALTGVSPMANGLGVLALLITMAGIGLVVRRRATV